MVAADVRCGEILKRLGSLARIGVEIGVYRGDLSCRLLARDPSLYLFLVDPWASAGITEYEKTNDKHATMAQEEHDAALALTQAATQFAGERCRIIRGTSAQVYHMFPEGSLDFVFIDGDHSYEGCSLDIDLWWPRVRGGGFLSGHDYRTDKPEYGVKRAVDEKFPNAEIGENYTWFVPKPWP